MVPGPIGAAISGIGAAIPARTPALAQRLQQGQPGIGFVPFQGFGVQQLAAGGAAGAVVQAARAAGGGLIKLAGAAGRSIWKVVLPSGKVVSRKNAVALAKRIGLDAAAVALGISATEMAGAIADESARRRRGRGITGRDLSTVRRTARKLNSAACALASIPRPAARAPRGRVCK